MIKHVLYGLNIFSFLAILLFYYIVIISFDFSVWTAEALISVEALGFIMGKSMAVVMYLSVIPGEHSMFNFFW